MITFVCFRWGSKYKAEYVNTLRRMIDRHCTVPHELVCATDDATGLDAGIRVVPLERQLIPIGHAFPKLAAFRPDAVQIFGKRICLLDLDVVIVASIDPIISRSEPFLIWQDVLAKTQPARFKYNSSLILMDGGMRSKVWRLFNTKTSPGMTDFCGSDQAWISQLLNGEATLTAADGVLSWRFEVANKPLPWDARLVFFHGRQKPWMLPDLPLVKQYWH